MKQNPCRYCISSFEHNGKHSPGWGKNCPCNYREEHEKYLFSQRKFYEGEPITTIDDLLNQEWVMWNGRTKNTEVFKHVQLATVIRFLASGAFKKAIRKEEGK